MQRRATDSVPPKTNNPSYRHESKGNNSKSKKRSNVDTLACSQPKPGSSQAGSFPDSKADGGRGSR